MAAATTEGVPPSLDDIEAALTLSVSEALCRAATSSPFLPGACGEAAKAYKHQAFAARLSSVTEAAGRVAHALKAAEATVLAGVLANKPDAERFIDAAGVETKPQLTSKRITGPLGTVTTRSAPDMMTLWTLRHGVAHFGRSVCEQMPESADHAHIAVKLADGLQQLPAAALSVLDAWAAANPSDAPPAKRFRNK